MQEKIQKEIFDMFEILHVTDILEEFKIRKIIHLIGLL